MIGISKEVLLAELTNMKDILTKWEESVTNGIPGADVPAPIDRMDDFLRQLCGELSLVAGKCVTIVEIVSDDISGS